MLVKGSTAIDGFRADRGGTGVRDAGGRLRPASSATLIDPHRPLDVLQRLLAHVLEGEVEPVADMVAHRCRRWRCRPARAMPSRRAATLTPSPKMSSPSTMTSPRLTPMRNSMRRSSRNIGVALAHVALDLGGAGDRIHDARELDQHAVAGELDDAPPMLGDLGVDQLLAMRLERRERGGLVDAHEAAVADHIGGQNSGQTAFHAHLPRKTTQTMTLHADGRLPVSNDLWRAGSVTRRRVAVATFLAAYGRLER